MYIECSQCAIFVHMTALMLLYIGDELCHIYTYKNRSGLLTEKNATLNADLGGDWIY